MGKILKYSISILYITKLKLSKCLGPDEISPQILKMAVDNTSKALNLIFNRSLLHWEIPADWKNGNVVPKSIERRIKKK